MSIWLPKDDALIKNPQLLEEALARYRRLLNGSGYAFWEWGLHDGSYSCGGSFWEKLGYKAVVDSVDSVDHVQEYVHPDDFGFVYNVVVDHLRHNKPIDMVYRVRAADGTYCWTQSCASSTRDSNGRVTYITGVNFDLSHLKETEKALRLSEARHERVLSSSNDGIWEWSATDANEDPRQAGKIGRLHTSHSFWSYLGYSEEEVDALPENERLEIWKSHIHPHDLPNINRVIRQHIRLREPIDIEYRMFGERGQIFWVRTRGNGIFNTHGRMILISGINIDITQVKESEERVRKAKEIAEKANRSKSNFLSSISHELRTPLNAILGFSRLLKSDQSLSVSHRENADYIYNAGNYLLQLINDILDLAQIEAGKLALAMVNLKPAELIEESFHYFKTSAESRKIRLRFEPDQLKDAMIQVDSRRLRQCLLNLISNAIKYNIDGGEVLVTFENENGDLVIAVKDTGPGVPAEKRASLFEMFNRLGAERSAIEGTGVGLVITRQLTLAMGGDLSYCQKATEGACFKLHFPLQQPSELMPHLAAGGADGVMQPIEDLQFAESRSIFYIEDNEPNIRLLDSWLEPYEQLSLASQIDPYVGLYEIRQQQPDMILLDINLPGLSGYDLLKIIKADPQLNHIPVVAISASAMQTDIDRGLAAGFDEYLTKPLDMNRLAATLNRFFIQQAA